MADQNFCAAAIDATSRSTNTYIKFLSANDTGLTGGHQSGVQDMPDDFWRASR